jgi:phage tail-like protein
MADDGSSQSQTLWPLAKFSFQVKWDSFVILFHEASGLDEEAQPIEFRHGKSALFNPAKMPGLKKFGNITLKRGVITSDNAFWVWLDNFKTNKTKPLPMTITLLDENDSPTMVWTLKDAWPAKITSTDLKALGNEIAIDTLVIAHEGLTIAKPEQ